MAIVKSEPIGRAARRALLVAPRFAKGSAALSQRLEAHGVDVTAAADARAARHEIETQTFDLVICDIGLPGGSGLEVLRALRARDPQVPVFLLCGAERPWQEAAELGAFCLEESIGPELLLRVALRRIGSYAAAGRRGAHASVRTGEIHAVAATVAKNQFGRLLGTAVRGERIVITKHDAPTAVLISFDEYQDLTGAETPDLDALSREFDERMARMQTPAQRQAVDALFQASSAELAEAATAEGRRDARSPERG